MNGYIVTEGGFGVTVLSRLLAAEVQLGLRIVPASGKSAAQSLARSLVAARRRPVALVLDADTTDEASVRRQRLVARELLAMASPGVPTQVFMAVPTIEALFFADRQLLERLVGDHIPDNQWAAGRFQPRETLQEMLRTRRTVVRSVSDLLSRLTDAEAERMGKHPLVRRIRQFIKEPTLPQAAEA